MRHLHAVGHRQNMPFAAYTASKSPRFFAAHPSIFSHRNTAESPLILANILIPDLRMLLDKPSQQIRTLLRVQINDLHPKPLQPLHPALKIPALPHHQRLNPKLPDQPAAIPARSQSRHHNLVAISPLPSRPPKRIRLTMHRRISLLHPLISSHPSSFSPPTNNP